MSARLAKKLEEVTGADSDAEARRDKLVAEFEFPVWILAAAERVKRLQAVTHSLKPVHPSAKGSSVYCVAAEMVDTGLVGTYCLGTRVDLDVVGNAAVLDVYSFLRLPFEGSTLLHFMLSGDADVSMALSDDVAIAAGLVERFTGIVEPRGATSSHGLAKQLYWNTATAGGDEQAYHLLAPLFATSLAHRVFMTVDSARFGELSKEARLARREGRFSDQVVHDYADLAVQKLGGTKPQNISQLNSERRGGNYLFASLPPRWKSAGVTPLLKSTSMFTRFERRSNVGRQVRELLAFLQSDPSSNLATRERRDMLVMALVEELVLFTLEMRTLDAGWSQSVECQLGAAERRWLDPRGYVSADEGALAALPSDLAEPIGQAFARWLNRRLRDPLPMGDAEYHHWCSLAQRELELVEDEDGDEF